MMTILETDSVSYSDLRQELKGHLDQCNKYGKRFKIIRNGKAEGILISLVEWEQIVETLSIVTDAKMMEQLVKSEKDIKAGRFHKARDVFKELLGQG